MVSIAGQSWVADTPNVLAVPKQQLRDCCGRLDAEDQLRIESAIDFMLRGY